MWHLSVIDVSCLVYVTDQRCIGLAEECIRDGALLELLAKLAERAKLYGILLAVTTIFIEVSVALEGLI